MGWQSRSGLILIVILFSHASFAEPIVDPQSADSKKPRDIHLAAEPPDLRVVQTREHTKGSKFNLGIGHSGLSNDPFLNTTSLIAWFGYNFIEDLGLTLSYSRVFNSNSSAQETAVIFIGYGTNNNPIQSILAAELVWSVLYGKVSFLGKKILHFDVHFLGGAASLNASNGVSLAPIAGIGQQLFINHYFSLRVDYRFYYFSENIVERNKAGPTLGQVIGNRTNLTGAFTIGASFSFGIW